MIRPLRCVASQLWGGLRLEMLAPFPCWVKKGTDKFCTFTNTHPHLYHGQASENLQVNQIFVNQILCSVHFGCFLFKEAQLQVQYLSSHKYQCSYLGFQSMEALSVQVRVCTHVRLCTGVCAFAFILTHKRIHE